ncbi:MAG: response regulator, partial [Lachnospiraceae bacterium]|nr:response regulator [Lachnospiraceae bacterium]
MFKKIREYLNDESIELRDRMFAITSYVAAASFFFSVPLALASGGIRQAIGMLMGAVVLLVLINWSIKHGRQELAALIISAIIILISMPYAVLSTGGATRGVAFGYVLTTLYVSIVLNGWIMWLLIALQAAVAAICFYSDYTAQLAAGAEVSAADYLQIFVAAFLISTVVAAIVSFQNRMNRLEKTKSDKRAEEIEQLNQSQNRFFSSMSHEIRTPINTIIGLNEMTLREEISDEVVENSKNIAAASKMLLSLINDILDKSKLESGKMELTPVPYNTGDMFSEIVGMIWVRAKEKNLEFHINIDPMLPAQLYGDEVRIKQVLINLLTNAVKYTSEGSVTLSVQYEKKSDRHAEVTYMVSDTGMGVKKESIPYLFTAFKRVDEDKNRYIEGTGLGLSIVKEFVEMMNGKISVNSVYTQGSTFMVTIPQGIENEQAVGELNLEARHSTGARKHYRCSFEAPEARILVVDDTTPNLLVVKKLLRDTKVNVDTAESGKEALKKTLNNTYDLILMDHLMPEMDGIECMHAIREQTGGMSKDTKIIVLTANAGTQDRDLYSREGFDGYLVKPINGEVLEAEVAKKLPSRLVKSMSDELGEDVAEEQVSVQRNRYRIPVMITTESVCDLPKDYYSRDNIAMIPYHVETDDGDFLDGVEAEANGLLSYMLDGRSDARSVEPSVSEYESFFARNLTLANHVIHIAMSSKVGKGYERATEAARSF